MARPRQQLTAALGAITALALLCLAAADPAPKPKPGQVEKAYAGKRFAVVVGVNEFADAKWRSLQFAVKDAQDLAQNLKDPGQGGFNDVILLASPWETTADSVRVALKKLQNLNMSQDDVVLLYFSTHGALARDPSGLLRQYLVTHDAKFDNLAPTALPRDEVLALFNGLTSKKKVIIFATCFSGQGKSELTPQIQDELTRMKGGFFVKPLELVSEAAVIIGACDWTESAQENPSLQHDIYTYFLLEAFKKGDRNGDGGVSISEAHDYAQRMTYYFTKGAQRPTALSDILGADPIILAGKITSQGKPVLTSHAENLKGASLEIDGQKKGPLPDGYAVEKGWLNIDVYFPEKDKTHFKGKLYVREGELVDLDRLVEDRSQPPVGPTLSFRAMGGRQLAQEVMPDSLFYGMAYQIPAFPFTDTTLRIEAGYAQAIWQDTLSDGREASVSASALDLSAALLVTRRWNQTTWFAGPVLGGLIIIKDVGNLSDDSSPYNRDSGTIYPGLLAGLRLHLSPSVQLELADRLTYSYFNVSSEQRSSLANQISAACYLDPESLIKR